MFTQKSAAQWDSGVYPTMIKWERAHLRIRPGRDQKRAIRKGG